MPDMQKQSTGPQSKAEEGNPKKPPANHHPAWRYFGAPVLGIAITFGGLALAIGSGTNAAVSAGVLGTPGTYTVSDCYDTDHRSHHSSYECEGTFRSDDGTSSSFDAALDEAQDYPADEKLRVRENPLGSGDTYRETGLWPTLFPVFLAGVGLVFLGLGLSVFKQMKAPKPTKPATPRNASDKLTVTQAIGMTGGLIALLDVVVALIAGLVRLVMFLV
ncbi:hypothetical protein [Streptomyces sp. NPDC046805]|uniref:hypothetical protein n=1 Tax=Streptomyces sp. NPDC046805 TaxID=3155134 RepID=UPI0033D6B870